MFEKILGDDLNIYAVSAANAHESSWGTYCYPDGDLIGNKNVGTCLGDLFSINWMEDSEKAKMDLETLQDQYKLVKKLTAKSHVLQWGDLSWTSEPIGFFESAKVAKKKSFIDLMKNMGKDILNEVLDLDALEIAMKNDHAIDSRDIKMHFLYQQVMTNPTPENHQALKEEITHRMKVDQIFQTAFPHHMEAIENHTTPLPTDFECYRNLIKSYEDKCMDVSEYSLKYFKAFVAECEALKAFPSALDSTLHRLDKACGGIQTEL